MQIKASLIRQQKNSVDCGPSVLAMLLKATGTKADPSKEIPKYPEGTYAPQLGTYLISQGYRVNIVLFSPFLFTKLEKKPSQEEIRRRCIEKSKDKFSAKNLQRKRAFTYFAEFIEAGGRVIPEIPSIKHVRTALEKGNPIIALLTSNMLTSKKPSFNSHFNLVTGIDKTHVTVLDPIWDKRGGKKRHRIEDFLYAVHATAYGCPDNASFIIAEKRT